MKIKIRYIKVGKNKFFGEFPHELTESQRYDASYIAELAAKDLKEQHCCGLRPFRAVYLGHENHGEVIEIRKEKGRADRERVIGSFEIVEVKENE